jgi:hypothetical protein
VPEIVGRFVNLPEGSSRRPAINSYALLYTSDGRLSYGVDVCNGTGTDAHVSIWIVPSIEAWTSGAPPPYTVVVERQRVESSSDGGTPPIIDGNVWVAPVKNLNDGDMVVVQTDVLGVTFYGHGYKFTPEAP